MNVISRGIRNAFRNQIRTFSIVVILGLSMGLALAMLVAHQAVGQKIKSVKSSVGNTITIAPAGFSGFSQVNNALSTSDLSKVSSLSHVTNVTEELTGRLTTIGSSSPSFGFGNQSSSSTSSNNQTSLTSPVQLNTSGSSSSGNGPRLFVNGGQLPVNFTPPITIVGTNNSSSVDGESLSISSGTAIDASKDSNDAMISTTMASKNNLKVGSTFTAYGATLTVQGIFSTNTQAGDNNVIVSLPAEQRLSGQTGDVTSAVATVDSLDNLSLVTSAIKSTLGSSADVTSAVDQANQTVQPLENIQSISLYSLIGAVIAGAVIILLTMIMIVRERRREIGVIKAIGASNFKIMIQFMTEAITLTVLGSIIGIGLGVVAGNPITKLLVNNSTSSTTSTAAGTTATAGGTAIRTRGGFGGGIRNFGGGIRNNFSSIHGAVGWSIILYGLGAAIIIAIVGSTLASFFISKVRPAEVMRTE